MELIIVVDDGIHQDLVNIVVFLRVLARGCGDLISCLGCRCDVKNAPSCCCWLMCFGRSLTVSSVILACFASLNYCVILCSSLVMAMLVYHGTMLVM